jgi:hypothetical protein
MLGRVINGDDSARLPARLGARWGSAYVAPRCVRDCALGRAPRVGRGRAGRPVCARSVRGTAAEPERSHRGPAAQLSNREPGTVESVVAPVKGRLSRASVFVEHQWVQVYSASCWRAEFYAVGSPVGLHDVAQLLQGRERLGFVRCVEVHVKVAVWSGLPANQGSRRLSRPPTNIGSQRCRAPAEPPGPRQGPCWAMAHRGARSAR